MEDWKFYYWHWFVIGIDTKMSNVKKDKFGVRLKYPERDCKTCKKYPCFEGIDKCICNFASYGCNYYSNNDKI